MSVTFNAYHRPSCTFPCNDDEFTLIASGLSERYYLTATGSGEYAVTAVNANGESAYSNIATLECSLPAGPTGGESASLPSGADQVRTYYYAGGQRIALRVQTASTNVVYFLHGDQLGSTSLASQADGVLLAGSRTYYAPFGAKRGTGGTSLPTDYRFTGQRQEADAFGLYDYNARFYDPYLGRFISADTIVPSPANPQSLNRYSYVLNNALKYTDPTGHFVQCNLGQCWDDGYSVANPSFQSSGAEERRMKLLEYNNKLAAWSSKGWLTDLEAFAQLADYAASMIPGDISGSRAELFVADLGSVLVESWGNVLAGMLGANSYELAHPLGQSGFDAAFQYPGTGGQQPHHMWFYVMLAFRYGENAATFANLAHETLVAQRGVGRSYQDFALGQQGGSLGLALSSGEIGIEQVGTYLRQTLSPGSSAASNWRGDVREGYFSLVLGVGLRVVPEPEGDADGGRYD